MRDSPVRTGCVKDGKERGETGTPDKGLVRPEKGTESGSLYRVGSGLDVTEETHRLVPGLSLIPSFTEDCPHEVLTILEVSNKISLRENKSTP